MARVNVGVDPRYLADQHLIAEHVEITMITGGLKKNNFIIKSSIPEQFKLGSGHINFFKTKIIYLKRRLEAVKKEMKKRGFKPSCNIDLSEFPKEYLNDWKPNKRDTDIIRERIIWKVRNKPGYWRYNRELVDNIDVFCDYMEDSKLFYV